MRDNTQNNIVTGFMNKINILLLSACLLIGASEVAVAGSTIVTDAVGTQTLWTFDENLGVNNLTSKVNQTDSKGISKTYDANNNLLSMTDEEGRVTTYTYNATNQKVSMTEASGTPETRTSTYEYLSADIDLVTKVSQPSVRTGSLKETITAYDTERNVTAVTIKGFTPAGNAVTRAMNYQYHSIGRVTQIDGARTDTTDTITLTYYDCNTGAECGQLKNVTNALGHVTTYDSYDGKTRLTQSTDANGTVTTYTYHLRGWLLSIVQAPTQGNVRTTSYTYDNAGQLLTITSPDNIVLTYSYDEAHDLRSITDNFGNKIEYTYDAKGNRTEEKTFDPDNTLVRTLTTQYDIRNFIQSINSAGSVTQMLSDAAGNLNTQTDPNVNPSTQISYDGLYRLQQTIDALTNNTNYQYNVADQLISVQAPNGATTQYDYDDLGNMLKEISPDRGTLTYTHNDAGNVLSISDARGITTSYSYDALNRLTNITYPDTSENISYTYDEQLAGDPASNICGISIGRVCQITDPSGQTNYAYDAWGNVLTETKQEVAQVNDTNQDTQTYVISYSYDEGDRIITQINPTGLQIDYTRDAIGRITDIGIAYQEGNDQDVLTGRTYRADGLPTGHTLGNGLADARQYDLQGRLTQQDITGLFSKTYSYDANGNILTQDTTPDAVLKDKFQEDGFADPSYTYDPLDRIIGENSTLGSLIFTYDENGNRINKQRNTKDRPYSYTSNTNQLTSVNNKAVTLDALGNTLSDKNGKRQYSYNQRNQLKTFSKNGQLRGNYQYNAYNQRTSKQHTNKNNVQRTFHYQYDRLGNLIGEHRQRNNGNYAPRRSYIWLNNEPVAQITFKLNNSQAIKHITHITTDHLNTPRIGTDETAQIAWRWDSDAFGQAQPNNDLDGNDSKRNIRLRFAGQYKDGESGLYYNWNRYYDSNIGRYITSDPIGLGGGINTYAYVGGNPVNAIDPNGLDACFVNFSDYPITYSPGETTTLLGGHSGVIGWDKEGSTRYYDYGRYSSGGKYGSIIGEKLPGNDGNYRRIPIPDLVIGPDGKPTAESLAKLKEALKKRVGKNTDADLKCDAEADEDKVYKKILEDAKNKARKKYSWNPFNSNHCRSIANDAYESGRKDTGWW